MGVVLAQFNLGNFRATCLIPSTRITWAVSIFWVLSSEPILVCLHLLITALVPPYSLRLFLFYPRLVWNSGPQCPLMVTLVLLYLLTHPLWPLGVNPFPGLILGFIFVLLIWESELDCGDSERDLLFLSLGIETVRKACKIFFSTESHL